MPFILLLPNRIDQEHFVSIVAKAIGSTTDAIRFEVDRLRDEAKLQPPSTDVPQQSVAPKLQTNSARSAFLYLTVMQEVVDPAIASVIRSKLQSYIPQHEFTISDSERAELSFAFENQIQHMPQLALEEDIVSKLNFLRKKLLEHLHAQKRTALSELERAGDTDAVVSALKEIQDVQQELRQESLTIEIFESK